MIVHKLLLGAGAEVWLPFGLSKLRQTAQRFGPSRYFSEKYWIEGFSVEVRQAPPSQYLTIRALVAAAIEPPGTDRWYDVETLAVIPWQSYSAQTFVDTLNYEGGDGLGGIFTLDDDADFEDAIVDLPDVGERSAWWQITAAAAGTLDADVLQNVGSPAGTLLDVITTDVVDPVILDNVDFSDCYVVAHGTTSVTGVALTSGKVYWIRVAITDESDVTYKLRITVTL